MAVYNTELHRSQLKDNIATRLQRLYYVFWVGHSNGTCIYTVGLNWKITGSGISTMAYILAPRLDSNAISTVILMFFEVRHSNGMGITILQPKWKSTASGKFKMAADNTEMHLSHLPD